MTTPAQTLQSYAARLHDALAHSPACVGLDPVLESLPESLRAQHWEPIRAIEHFSRAVLDAVAPHIRIVKPQSACFERHASQGLAALERTIRHARDLGLLVILDAKRGDIGISAAHYAAAAANLGAHAITVSAYLGPETVEPYLDAGLGVFILVRTSNPGGDVVQARRLQHPDQTVAQMMAAHVHDLAAPRPRTAASLSVVGAVVGATKAAEGAQLRAAMPDTPFLVPGYGAQGGTPDDVRRLLRPGARTATEAGIIVNSSRAILYPKPAPGQAWQDAVAAASASLVRDLAAIVGT